MFEYLISDALRGYDFEVIRADMISSPGKITDDMINYIQNAELCIIVLTDHNANVYYECGRRHETGRPFIHLIRKDQVALFDLKDFRCVQYDLSSLRAAKDSVERLRESIEHFEQTGYGETTGVSLAAINESIKRIDRRLELLLSRSGGGGGGGVPGQQNELTPQDRLDPRKGFLVAAKRGDVRTCALLLPLLEERLGPVHREYIAAAGLVAQAGSELGAARLLRVYEQHGDQLDTEGTKHLVGAVVEYYCATDREAEGLPRLKPVFEAVVRRPGLQPTDQAWFLNQMQKLFYGTRAYDEALEVAHRVIELAPDEVPYLYNTSLILNKLERLQQAVEFVDRYMGSDRPKIEDHLAHALRLYIRAERHDSARGVYAQMLEQFPGNDMLTDPNVRRTLAL